MRRRVLCAGALAAALLAGPAGLTGCGRPGDTAGREGGTAAESGGTPGTGTGAGAGTGAGEGTGAADGTARPSGAGGREDGPETGAREEGSGTGRRAKTRGNRERAHGSGEPVYRRWGLTAPLAPRPRTPDRPPAAPGAAPGLPPVVDHIPTKDEVVFLTFDDGAERDPRFVDLVRELRLPVTMFLTDSVAGPGYGHFARLRGVGAGLQNHTLDHRSLRGLPYAGQRAEICGQQEKLNKRFGIRPRLLRPPYGTYDTATLHAAAECGISAVVLGRASMQADGLRYTTGPNRLRPGDIVIVMADFRALEAPGGASSLARMTTRLLRRIQGQGLTVGRLEDYL
ncbi:polysaccharide deacetylase family protein [Streptomyces poonensis]|uniref:NodB homology domain-containing protein n=1 Tax=Streptomyces poonensis TaxID=68255 RepID=A0A918P9Y6_9ACTN|nr:polysaccharide deacetylase family protein [Streptomyces poonensis]GGY92760.1 hypothetical protein GCM10010365_09140 [Streptomyces poonensis]GLJ87646.1 hypothetical protein GCM10017589_02460 [Streptomyces poonensis]